MTQLRLILPAAGERHVPVVAVCTAERLVHGLNVCRLQHRPLHPQTRLGALPSCHIGLGAQFAKCLRLRFTSIAAFAPTLRPSLSHCSRHSLPAALANQSLLLFWCWIADASSSREAAAATACTHSAQIIQRILGGIRRLGQIPGCKAGVRLRTRNGGLGLLQGRGLQKKLSKASSLKNEKLKRVIYFLDF